MADQLKAKTTLIGELGQEEVEAWRALGQADYEVYEEYLTKLGPVTAENIQNATGIMITQTPIMTAQAKSMSQAIINQFDKDFEFRSKALADLQGFLNGMTDENLKSLLESAGVQDVESVMKGIREGNLGETEGKNILTSLNGGLQDNSYKGTLFATAKSIANSLSDLLSVKPKIQSSIDFIKSQGSHADGLAYVPYNGYVARLHEGERVLTKKENADYARNNISNKSSNITVNFYPQQMTEAEIDRASRYINRKWGARA